jgi:hypothetical protein
MAPSATLERPGSPRVVPDVRSSGPWGRAPTGPRGRAVLAALVLLVVYVGLSFVNDPHGFLGTDTGGKMATLDAMASRGGTSVDLGYWAEAEDPSGSLHPLYYTFRVGSGASTQWVNVTTVPAVEIAAPLYRLGGARAVLAVPMLGAVLCAFAARRLARRLGGSAGTAWTAFWVVGLASPVTIYALDFWEHTLGLAAMAWGLGAFLSALDARTFRSIARAGAIGGLLFGVAATMRTEALLYGLVVTTVVGLAMVMRPPAGTGSSVDDVRPRPSGPEALAALAALGSAALVSLVVPLVANDALERNVIGGPLRAARAAGTASGAGASTMHRLGEGLTTTFATSSRIDQTLPILLGVGLTAAVALTIRASLASARSALPAATSSSLIAVESPARTARVALWMAVAIGVVVIATGPGFVPGLFAAAPIAGVGLLAGSRLSRDARLVRAIALVSLPLVWAFQFTGGALPQWGGRYVLLSGFLAVVVGVVVLGRAPTATRRALVMLAVLVTGGGLWWTHVRTHAMADAGALLAARPEPMLISTEAHLFREVGPVAYGRPWLTVEDRAGLDRAIAIAEARDVHEIGLVQLGPDAGRVSIAGWARIDTDSIALFDAADAIHVITYRR